jgi:hypothetical protein
MSPKDFNVTNGNSRYMPMPHRVEIHSNKKGTWLRQLNTLTKMDTDIQQLLIEDLCRQVEDLVCILRLYNIYVVEIY